MRTFHPWLLAVALCACPSSLLAETAPAPAPQDEAAQAADSEDTIDDLIDEFDEAMDEFWELHGAAETDEERSRIYREHYPDAEVYGARIWLLVAARPEDEAVPAAIGWMLRSGAAGEHTQACLAILVEHHLGSPDMADICAVLSQDVRPATERFLREVREKSADGNVKGQATYALSGLIGSRLELRAYLQGADEETRASYTEYYGEEFVAFVLDLDLVAAKAEREKLLVEVRDNYGDVKTRWGTLGSAAASQLFELHHLQIGMVAPDIVGPDLDGVELKLSDYRGKVVFLDFWGDW